MAERKNAAPAELASVERVIAGAITASTETSSAGSENFSVSFDRYLSGKTWETCCHPQFLPRNPTLFRGECVLWPKASFHRSLGQRPRNVERKTEFGRRPSSHRRNNPRRAVRCQGRSEYGRWPKLFYAAPIPGASPQATVRNGLRPNG